MGIIWIKLSCPFFCHLPHFSLPFQQPSSQVLLPDGSSLLFSPFLFIFLLSTSRFLSFPLLSTPLHHPNIPPTPPLPNTRTMFPLFPHSHPRKQRNKTCTTWNALSLSHTHGLSFSNCHFNIMGEFTQTTPSQSHRVSNSCCGAVGHGSRAGLRACVESCVTAAMTGWYTARQQTIPASTT